MALWTRIVTGVAVMGISAAASAAPTVLVSIKPLYGLTAALMEGLGTPRLLLAGTASPHGYSLRPSDAQALSEADVVVWVGPSLETFLVEPLETLAEDSRIVEAMEADGITLLAAREGGIWAPHVHHHADADEEHEHEHADDEDEHEHEHAEDEHEHEHAEHEEDEDEHHDEHEEHEEAHHHHEGEMGMDPHVWLDPLNATAIAEATAAALIAEDPDNAARYRANLAELEEELAALDASLATSLAPLRGRSFLVFHDAYQYLDRRYGLDAAGSVAVSPEHRPGARRMAELRALILQRGVACVFAEPQFSSALMETLVEGTDVGFGTLDPLGVAVEKGPKAYQGIMKDLDDSLVACLTPAG